MKRLLTLSILGVFLAFSFSTAHAASGTLQCVTGMYMSAKAGVSILSDSDLSYSDGSTAKLSFDTGWGLDLALGYQWPMFRIEGEVAYRSNDADEFTDITGIYKVNGDVKAWSGMVNGYYDFSNTTFFTPYVGGGIGMARIDGSSDELGWDDNDTVFAYQLMAGAAFSLTNQISLEAEYRYFATQDPEFDDNLGGTVKAEVSDHNVMVGLRIVF